MSVEREHIGDVTVLKVDGDLAGVNAEDLRLVAYDCINEGQRDFIIDLANATGCDSAGLETLTWFQQECQERLGLVKLRNMSDVFRKILDLTRLKDRLAGGEEDF